MLVAIGVTNRGGCASSQSSGSLLILGNQKLRKEALLVGRFSQYLCILEIKPIPVKTATEVGVRAIQDHKVIEWNTYWKCRLLESTDDM